jgi:hypothetical protein
VETVEPTGSGFQLSVGDLKAYIRAVVDSYYELVREFRLHEGDAPSLLVALNAHRAGYDAKAARSVLLAEAKAIAGTSKRADADMRAGDSRREAGPKFSRTSRRAAGAERGARKEESDSSSRSPSPKRSKKARGGGRGSGAPAAAFPSMKQPGRSVVEKAVEEGRGKFKNFCSDFLFRKCTRMTCKYKHVVPSGFKAFLRQQGYDDLGPIAKGVEQE